MMSDEWLVVPKDRARPRTGRLIFLLSVTLLLILSVLGHAEDLAFAVESTFEG